jgi:uncharacterized membrane protein
MIWGWVLSNEWTFGLAVGAAELVTKLVLYYVHDRLWIGAEHRDRHRSHTIHVFKTITWRILGTLDTILLSWYISGSLQLGLQLGGVEILTKMLLYYIHERIWFQIKWSGNMSSADV